MASAVAVAVLASETGTPKDARHPLFGLEVRHLRTLANLDDFNRQGMDRLVKSNFGLSLFYFSF